MAVSPQLTKGSTVALIRRVSTVDQIVTWMREQILDGTWLIGSRIPTEAEIAATLGVGRNSVREAVRSLAHNGLLESHQGTGTYVRSDNEIDAVLARRIESASFDDTAELRRALEVEASILACSRATSADVEMIESALEERLARSGDRTLDAYIEADYRFHLGVVNASGNVLLIDLFRCVAPLVRRPIEERVDQPDEAARDQAHRDVLTAIRTRNVDLALRAAQVHLNVRPLPEG